MSGTTAFGIDIGGSGMKAAPVDVERGELLAERHKILTPKPATPDAVAEVVDEIVDHFADATGDSPIGVTVPAVVIHGTVLSAEHREVGEFTWLGTLDPRVAAIEVHTTLRAERAGEHLVGPSGPGEYRLTLGGELAFEGELALPEGADIAEALFATAIGLFAAIPAVIAYNRLLHKVGKIEGHLHRFGDSLHMTLSRELERN